MPVEVKDAKRDSGSIQNTIDTFAAGVSSVDYVDVTNNGQNRVIITMVYTA